MKLVKKLQQLERALYDNILVQKGAAGGMVFKRSGSAYVHGSRDPTLSLLIKVCNILFICSMLCTVFYMHLKH